MLALLSTLALADDLSPEPAPSPDALLAEARRHSTRGGAWITSGSLALGGGVAVLLVRKGEPGDPIDASGSTLVNDLRSVGGAVLVMSGFVAVYGGAQELGTGAGLRERARSVTLLPTPGGVVLSGRF
jgi:hypothetical protein